MMYENGVFVFKDFRDRQIWPRTTEKNENVCWNAVRVVSGHQREFEKDETISFGFLKINQHESRSISNVDAPLHTLPPFKQAVIGSFSFNSEQKESHPIIQYPDKISFSWHGDVVFATKYRFDAVSSPLHFNGGNVLVSLIGQRLDFTDMETKRTIEAFRKESYLESAGVLRHEKRDYLVVITSKPYEGNAELCVHDQRINFCEQRINEVFSQKISGRSHKLVEGPDNSLIAYHRSGAYEFSGLKISIK